MFLKYKCQRPECGRPGRCGWWGKGKASDHTCEGGKGAFGKSAGLIIKITKVQKSML